MARASYFVKLKENAADAYSCFLFCHQECTPYQVTIPSSLPWPGPLSNPLHVSPHVKYNMHVFGSPLECETTKKMGDEKDHYKLLIELPGLIVDDYLAFVFIISSSPINFTILSGLSYEARFAIASIADVYLPKLLRPILEGIIIDAVTYHTSAIFSVYQLIRVPNFDILKFSSDTDRVERCRQFLRILCCTHSLNLNIGDICRIATLSIAGIHSDDSVETMKLLITRLIHYFPYSFRVRSCDISFLIILLGDDEEMKEILAAWSNPEEMNRLRKLENKRLNLDIELATPEGHKYIRIIDVARKMRVHLLSNELLTCEKLAIEAYQAVHGRAPLVMQEKDEGVDKEIRWYKREHYGIIRAVIRKYLGW